METQELGKIYDPVTFCQDAEIVSDVLSDFHATVFHATVFHATVFHATVAQILAAEDEV